VIYSFSSKIDLFDIMFGVLIYFLIISMGTLSPNAQAKYALFQSPTFKKIVFNSGNKLSIAWELAPVRIFTISAAE